LSRNDQQQKEKKGMSRITEFLERDEAIQMIDEPSPPNTERKGLWRVLAASTVASVIALAAVAILFV